MMRKLQILTASALLALMLPGVALAHDDGEGNHGGPGFGWFNGFRNIKADEHRKNGHGGTVTAVSSNSFTMKLRDNSTVTVNISTDTKIMMILSKQLLQLADIHVNDRVFVKGDMNGTQIDANKVFVIPANTHPARIPKGTVTAVSGNTVTVQTNNHGVISSVTVNTDANTTVKKADGSAGTMADVTVGSSVKVKGLWDEILN